MKQEQIQALLDRYLDGLTTQAEERRLRRQFARMRLVPPEWRPYQALFAWEQRGQAARRRSPYWLAAAGLALAVGITATLLHRLPADTAAPQNYAVIDGRLTTDSRRVAQEAEEALLMVSTTEDDTFDALNILAI